MKSQTEDWEKIFASHISNKRPVSRMHKSLKTLDISESGTGRTLRQRFTAREDQAPAQVNTRVPSRRTGPADTLTLDFCPADHERTHFCGLSCLGGCPLIRPKSRRLPQERESLVQLGCAWAGEGLGDGAMLGASGEGFPVVQAGVQTRTVTAGQRGC